MEYIVYINNLAGNINDLLEKRNIIIKNQIIFCGAQQKKLRPNDTLLFIESDNDHMIKAKAVIQGLQKLESPKNPRKSKMVIVLFKRLKKLQQFRINGSVHLLVPDELVVENIEAVKMI